MMSHSHSHVPPERRSTAWVGWILFSATMLTILGTFQAIMGLVALLEHSYYAVTRDGLVVKADYTIWGWTHLGIGVVACAAGLGAMLGQAWARMLGIVIAALSAIVNMAFLAAYPVWGVLVIAVDVIIIYALAVHGRDVLG